MGTRRRLGMLAAVGLIALGACGGDDDSSTDTTTAAPPTTAAPDTTAAATGTAYCQAHLAIEAASTSEEPSALGAAVAAATAVVPDEIAADLEAAAANAPTEPGPPDPAFTEPYGHLVDWVREHCGFAAAAVLAKDYSFGGLPGELPAGPTIVDLSNEGTEFHEIAVMHKADGVTDSWDDLLALPEEEVGAKAAFVGVAIAAPGESASTVLDLTAGDYIAICFIPTGTTPEVLAAGPPPEAEPHFAHGMRQEFTVA